ncbi:MAG: hypothetical protein KAS77_04795, partial [Thermoplasmata archaeon]|nr:hypothetical protein [Thermoplasmata archaeon]
MASSTSSSWRSDPFGGVASLVGARDGYFILYPQYFDSRISREEGRRVPR